MITFADLASALSAELPGGPAQQKMAVDPLNKRQFPHRNTAPRVGAVLALIYPHKGQLWLPLMLRTELVADHKGQISLPGGQREAQDTSLWETALREAWEELGIEPLLVRYAGALSPYYIATSHFQVYPFVGWAGQQPHFRLSVEAAELIELPLAALSDPHAKVYALRELDGVNLKVPSYRYAAYEIWGATAMILSELEAILTNITTA